MSRRIQRARGYTMMEVMMALALLAVGGMGVAATQKAVQGGNTNARDLATATAIGQAWIERLRADAAQWNEPNGQPDVADTRWLKQITTKAGQWFVPAEIQGVASPRADIVGADLFDGDKQAQAFCTHVRLTQLYPTLLRAEVRVYWRRSSVPVDCSANNPDAITGQYADNGFVYLTTGIQQNQAPN